jgi:hypothetical protein
MTQRAKQTSFQFLLAKKEARLKSTGDSDNGNNNIVLLRPSGHISGPVRTAFDMCHKHRKVFEELEGDRDTKLHQLLARVLYFYQIGHTDRNCKEAYKKVLEHAGVRITGNTKNCFIPAVKAVFGDTEKSNVGRYASVLFAANEEGITPERVGTYLMEHGGIVKTAKKGSELLNPNRGAEILERNNARLKDLEASAKPLKASQLSSDLPVGLSSALMRKHPDGSLMLLAFREEEAGIVSRYKPAS